jgi:predicted Zn-dependent peptidase
VVVVEHHRRPLVFIDLVLARGALSDPPNAAGATALAVQIASDYHEVSETGRELVEEKSLRRQAVDLGGAAHFESAAEFSVASLSGYAVDTPAYLSLLADAMTNPRQGDHSFKGRRDAFLDAIELLRPSDPAALERMVAEAAFGAGHPYARSEIGTRASLEALGLEDVVEQQRAVLVPEGATLLVVGDVDAAKVMAAARAAFKGWSGRRLPTPEVSAPLPPRSRQPVGFLPREPASTLLVCATRALGDLRASDEALEVLAAILGQGAGSRLQTALRERGELTYSASALIVYRRQARALLACSPLQAERASEGLRLFGAALEAMRTGRPGDAEVARARALRLARLEAAWDDALQIRQAWLEAIAMGAERPSLERRRSDLERVTADEVARLAREVLRPAALRWVVSGDRKAAALASEANGLGKPLTLTLGR